MPSTESEYKVRMGEVLRGMTMNVRVTGLKVWRVRLWLSMVLMRAAALVAGCGIHVESQAGRKENS